MTKRDEQFVKVTYICQKNSEEQWVYNLEVEAMHTYYVAEGELLVHNGEGVCPVGKVKIESAGECGIKTTINDGLGDYGMKMSY